MSNARAVEAPRAAPVEVCPVCRGLGAVRYNHGAEVCVACGGTGGYQADKHLVDATEMVA